MEQKNFIRNISGTACVLGLALSTMSVNSTMVVNGNHEIQKINYSYYNESSTNPLSVEVSNVYAKSSSTRLEEEANTLFGEMRNATSEEQASINRYIKSISRDTGVNFFDIC